MAVAALSTCPVRAQYQWRGMVRFGLTIPLVVLAACSPTTSSHASSAAIPDSRAVEALAPLPCDAVASLPDLFAQLSDLRRQTESPDPVMLCALRVITADYRLRTGSVHEPLKHPDYQAIDAWWQANAPRRDLLLDWWHQHGDAVMQGQRYPPPPGYVEVARLPSDSWLSVPPADLASVLAVPPRAAEER